MDPSATSPDTAATERQNRRRALYERLARDREFREFIIEDWLKAQHDELLEKLRQSGAPDQTQVAKDCWRLAETMWKHIDESVKLWRQQDHQAAELAAERDKRIAAGLPPDASPE
jgi:hypothetical protein